MEAILSTVHLLAIKNGKIICREMMICTQYLFEKWMLYMDSNVSAPQLLMVFPKYMFHYEI
jgi:hypothetical protein